MLSRALTFCRSLLALILGLFLLGVLASRPALAEDFLAPDKAFVFSSTVVDAQTVRLHWDIAPRYHLYRERISVQADAVGVKWDPLQLPAGKDEFDANFNKTVAVYRDSLDVNLRLTQGSGTVPLTIGWQGCADALGES
jgi:thiol:disulfide interchange protein DsbD